jgi:hypothetical protein
MNCDSNKLSNILDIICLCIDEITFSFHKYSNEYIDLKGYDYKIATNILRQTRDEIAKSMSGEFINTDIMNNNVIYDMVKEYLYPIIYVDDMKSNLKFKLDNFFSMNEHNKFEPIIVKNFIEILNKFLPNTNIYYKI